MNLLERLIYDPIPYAHRLLAIVVAMVLILFLLVGCASAPQVPECDKFQYMLVPNEGQLYYVLDQENAVKLIQLVEGLSEGTCQLPKE